MRRTRSLLGPLVALGLLGLASPAGADTVSGTRSTKLWERAHDLTITLARGWARIVVRRTFENGGEKHDQAMVHVTDLPPGAVAIGLRTQGDKGAWFEGDLLEAELAAKRYQELTGIGGYYPKDPALLSWRSADHLALQVFPVDPKAKKTVEYTLLVPTKYVDGKDVLELPRMGIAELPPTFTVKAEGKDDRVELAGLPVKGSQPLLAARTLELVRANAPLLGGSFASISVGKRAVLRTRIEAAARLSSVPKGAYVVVALDTSRSLDPELLAAEVAAARAYLSHLPDAHVQVVGFSRKVAPLHSGWVTAAQADKDLAAAVLPRKNGTSLDALFKDLAARLDTAPANAPRRALVLSDLRTRAALTPETLGTFDAQKGVLHLAEVHAGVPSLRRIDDGPWAKLPRASGGLAWTATLSGDAGNQKLQRAVTEEWARPLRIDALRAEGVGYPKSVPLPDSLAEGEGFDDTSLGAFATPALRLRGELWSKPIDVLLTPTVEERKRAAALAVPAPVGLTDPEMMTLALDGHAVSPVTSLLAIEPGVRPSTEGLDWDNIGGVGWGSGTGFGIGLGSMHGGKGSFDPKAWLRDAATTAFGACGGALEKVTVDVETTRAEIVAVRVAVDGAKPGSTLGACVEERLWDVELPVQFVASWANHRVSV